MPFSATWPAAENLRRVTCRFAPEWAAVAALLLIDGVWALLAGFSFALSWPSLALVILPIALALGLRIWDTSERGALIAEYFALTTLATIAFGVLSYLCCATNFPLADDALQNLDRALGFDWLYWFNTLQTYPLIHGVLKFAYGSLVYQALYFAVLFGLMGKKRALREMFWIVFVAGVLTAAESIMLPALGTFKTFGMEELGPYLPVMEHLRSQSDLHFALNDMTGVVSFPSFHTAMALVYCYGFRRTGPIGYAIVAINILMLLAIPFFGGHYLVDMIGGAFVAAAAIAITRAVSASHSAQSRFAFQRGERLARMR